MRSLSGYRKKRDFSKTPEPKGKAIKPSKKKVFVVQKHAATHLHYDLRLEVEGVLKSWAVPKGFPKTSSEKHLAVQTEDHPLEYAKFKGVIPKGQYGGGKIDIYDKGYYENLKKKNAEELPMKSSLREGKVEIYLHGKKIKGPYALIRFRGKNWLLIKMRKR